MGGKESEWIDEINKTVYVNADRNCLYAVDPNCVNVQVLFVQGANLNYIYTQRIVLRLTTLKNESYHDFILSNLFAFRM